MCTPYKSGRWVGDGARWWYVCNDGSGYLRSGWYLIGNRYYYFGPDGYMYTGWLNRGGRWYYLNNSGAMETGWVKVGTAGTTWAPTARCTPVRNRSTDRVTRSMILACGSSDLLAPS